MKVGSSWKWKTAAAVLAVVSALVIAFVPGWLDGRDKAREEYATAAAKHAASASTLAAARRQAQGALSECESTSSGTTSCDRLRAALKKTSLPKSVLSSVPAVWSTDRVVGETAKVRAATRRLASSASTLRDLARKARMSAGASASAWVREHVEPELSRASSSVAQARQVAAAAEGKLVDDGLRRQLASKADRLDKLISSTRSRLNRITPADGPDVITEISGLSSEVDGLAEGVRQAAGLAASGVVDRQFEGGDAMPGR